jgi:hypothetical protein
MTAGGRRVGQLVSTKQDIESHSLKTALVVL